MTIQYVLFSSGKLGSRLVECNILFHYIACKFECFIMNGYHERFRHARISECALCAFSGHVFFIPSANLIANLIAVHIARCYSTRFSIHKLTNKEPITNQNVSCV